LREFFRPHSVAVIGASEKPGKVGRVVLENILGCGYPGDVYPVNPHGGEILGLKAYPSVEELPEAPDLAVIIVPAAAVPSVLDQCGLKGIKAAVVISAGFKEAGREGYRLELELEEMARRHNMRVLGPNCLGLADTSTPLNATFARTTPLTGRLAFFSQSGALCTAALGWTREHGLGFSKFISIGNKMDVDEVDLLKALEDDWHSRVIAGYLEGIKRGEEFLRLAAEVTKKKPVVIFKAGTTQAGAKAVSSHTGTLAGSENAYAASFKRTGVIRAESMEELFHICRGFSQQPVPAGDRVAILTNAGGPGIITADALEKAGLKMAGLEEKTISRLKEHLPPASNFYNPVDVLGDALADRYRAALEALMEDANIDSIICILTPQAMTQPVETARVLVDGCAGKGKSVFAVFMGGTEIDEAEGILHAAGIPNYRFPETAVHTIRAMVEYRSYLSRGEDEVVSFEADREVVDRIFSRVLSEGRYQLGEMEAREVFLSYGIPVARTLLATNLTECIAAGREIGYPVVAKIASPQILHKTEVGGVKVGIGNTDELIEAYEEINANVRRLMPNATVWGVVVQEMLKPSRELIVGMNRDPQFGPLLMVGLGGIYVEVLKDVSFRLAPVGKRESMEMLKELKTYWLLRGSRGEKPADIGAVAEVIQRVSQLVSDFPVIQELDINPLRVFDRDMGCVAADARMIIGES